MRRLTSSFFIVCVMMASCREAPPAAPSVDAVSWDDASATTELDWPMQGVAASSADPTAFATPDGGGATIEIWRRLSPYASTFLRSWRSALEGTDDPAAMDVLDAFNELAYAITGPGGFWRKTVPQQWLGCGVDAATPPGCEQMTQAERELGRWDAIQKQIGELSPEQAARFLSRNKKRILAYLDTYVPSAPSATGMRDTAFYRTTLAAVLER